jgi:hypothetical protein
LANLGPANYEPAVVKVEKPKEKTINNDLKLKKLELNLNSFNKKYNDAVNASDANKSKRLKRILDVSKMSK